MSLSDAFGVLTVMQVSAAVLAPLIWWRHRFGSDSLVESILVPVVWLFAVGFIAVAVISYSG